mgnify:CR=1 FL=1
MCWRRRCARPTAVARCGTSRKTSSPCMTPWRRTETRSSSPSCADTATGRRNKKRRSTPCSSRRRCFYGLCSLWGGPRFRSGAGDVSTQRIRLASRGGLAGYGRLPKHKACPGGVSHGNPLGLLVFTMALLLNQCGDWGCAPGDIHLYDNCVSICNDQGNWETACFRGSGRGPASERTVRLAWGDSRFLFLDPADEESVHGKETG